MIQQTSSSSLFFFLSAGDHCKRSSMGKDVNCLKLSLQNFPLPTNAAKQVVVCTAKWSRLWTLDRENAGSSFTLGGSIAVSVFLLVSGRGFRCLDPRARHKTQDSSSAGLRTLEISQQRINVALATQVCGNIFDVRQQARLCCSWLSFWKAK